MEQKQPYSFEIQFPVRDYECDLQGIVNNANYLHYMEHTRHEFLRAQQVSFAGLHDRGIDCVVARINIHYKSPLRSMDDIRSRLQVKKEGLRFVFLHEIRRAADNALCAKAQVDIVCIVNGRLSDCEELNQTFAPFFLKVE